MRFFLLLLVPVLAFSCATVRLSNNESAALRTLERFLQLDQSGARLDPNRYHSVAEVVSPAETKEWDHFVVVSGWSISRPQENNGQVQTTVRYDVAGVMTGDVFTPVDSLSPEMNADLQEATDVSYTLLPDVEKWKVITPAVPPHVSFAVARRWAQDLGAEATLQELADAEYTAKLKSQRAGHCNCGRLDF